MPFILLYPRTALGFKDQDGSDGYERKRGLYQWLSCRWPTEIPTGYKVHEPVVLSSNNNMLHCGRKDNGNGKMFI